MLPLITASIFRRLINMLHDFVAVDNAVTLVVCCTQALLVLGR